MNHLNEIYRIIKVYKKMVLFKLFFSFIVIENIALRNLVGDPNRYTPIADHMPITTSPTKPLSSMYTIETRYQPFPPRVLPKPKVFYLERQIEEIPVMNQIPERETPPPNQPVTPPGFLQPRVLTQPIIYSIPGASAKTNEPIIINQIPPSPTVYAITGRPRRPTVDMSVNNSEIASPVIDRPPAIYSLVGSPRSLNQMPEPPRQTLTPSPNLYSLVGSPRVQNQISEPPKQLLQAPPSIYSVIGSPARTSRGIQVSSTDPIEPTPILYTIENDEPAPINKPKENRSPPIKKQPIDATVYTLGNAANLHYEQQPIRKPTTYTLVDKANSPIQEIRTKYLISYHIEKKLFILFSLS